MRATQALGILRSAAPRFFTTAEAAALLRMPLPSTSRLLHDLAANRLLVRVRHGEWTADSSPDPLVYGSWVTRPLPSYVSLYTALYRLGMITQIPQETWIISIGKTQMIDTALGSYSIHQVQPALFRGYVERDGALLATPEKALFDHFYLARSRSRHFKSLTEVDLPKDFSPQRLRAFVSLVPDERVRSAVASSVEAFLARSV
jgi:predicted transcriptional regulator of viral defense system